MRKMCVKYFSFKTKGPKAVAINYKDKLMIVLLLFGGVDSPANFPVPERIFDPPQAVVTMAFTSLLLVLMCLLAYIHLIIVCTLDSYISL